MGTIPSNEVSEQNNYSKLATSTTWPFDKKLRITQTAWKSEFRKQYLRITLSYSIT